MRKELPRVSLDTKSPVQHRKLFNVLGHISIPRAPIISDFTSMDNETPQPLSPYDVQIKVRLTAAMEPLMDGHILSQDPNTPLGSLFEIIEELSARSNLIFTLNGAVLSPANTPNSIPGLKTGGTIWCHDPRSPPNQEQSINTPAPWQRQPAHLQQAPNS